MIHYHFLLEVFHFLHEIHTLFFLFYLLSSFENKTMSIVQLRNFYQVKLNFNKSCFLALNDNNIIKTKLQASKLCTF